MRVVVDVDVDIGAAIKSFISVHCKNQGIRSSRSVIVVGGGGGGAFVVGGGGGGGLFVVGGGGGGLIVVGDGGGGGGLLIVVGGPTGPEQSSPLGQHPMTPLVPTTQYVL